MGKKRSQETPPEVLSDLFRTLFAADNPFRRKPETQPPPEQHLRSRCPSEPTIAGGDAGTTVARRTRAGDVEPLDVGAEKRKRAVSIRDSEEGDPGDGKKKRRGMEGEEATDGPGKRGKKRKRDELEVEYERRKLGYVDGDREGKEGEMGGEDLAVVVGRKRKEMDDGKEMVVDKESFDDEDKLLRTVFVGNLPLKTKRKVLLSEFKKFGKLESIRIRSVPILDSKIPRKGAVIKGKLNEAVDSVHAYIVFEDEQSAQSSLKMNMEKIGGNHIRVDMACPPRKKLKGESPLYNIKRTVFVGNLPFDVKDEELYQLFCLDSQSESTVEAIRVIRDPNTSLGKGIAYVLFKTREAANSIIRRKDFNIRGRDLRLSHAKADSTPSKSTPSKRSRPGRGAADFPSKRLVITPEKASSVKTGKPSKAGSLSYQGLRASKSGVQKKAKGTGKRQTSDRWVKSAARAMPAFAEQQARKDKRPAVAARKAKALKQAGLKRKQEGGTPERFHPSKKARRHV